jgi:carbonic anhydrase/acetyltransferase-like protein (isoleucine patch superfamily)
LLEIVGKAKNNRVISYSVGFVATVLTAPSMELTPEQIQQLEAQGNRSTNWAGVKLTGSPTASYENSLDKIRNCHFSGNIYIGVFVKNTTMEHGVTVPCGLYNSNFSGTCILSDNCYIFNTSMLCNVFIGRNSCIVNSGMVICEGQTSFGTQRMICVGPESDSAGSGTARTVTLNVNASYSEICASALQPKKDLMGEDPNDPNKKKGGGGGGLFGNSMRSNRNDDYIRYDLSIICDDVEIAHCHLVRNVFIGSYSKVNNSSIDSSSLLSHCVITHSELDNCVLHGSCTIASRSTVKAVLMFPHASIEHGANVEESVLGPDCNIASGECKRCLLGPFVGFHHSSLLIASCWPTGRGNIAYGCAIGSNHTGRSNDQECLPGEGCFFGLGTQVKFPFSVMYSPYSLIAASTNCLSQKISFPFSLISNYDSGAGANTLRPGWVLWSNPYYIERSITKFSKRRKSIEYRTDFPVFRPSIVDFVWDARNRLLSFKQSAVHSGNQQPVLLSEQQLSGAGRSLVPISDVDRAIDAYTQFIHRYALHVRT